MRNSPLLIEHRRSQQIWMSMKNILRPLLKYTLFCLPRLGMVQECVLEEGTLLPKIINLGALGETI